MYNTITINRFKSLTEKLTKIEQGQKERRYKPREMTLEEWARL